VAVSQDQGARARELIKWATVMLGSLCLAGLGIAVNAVFNDALWTLVLRLVFVMAAIYCFTFALRSMLHEPRGQRHRK